MIGCKFQATTSLRDGLKLHEILYVRISHLVLIPLITTALMVFWTYDVLKHF